VDSRSSKHFLREIRRTAALQHLRILSVLDSGEAGDQPYFVLPYMAGGTLRQRIEREKQMPIEDAVSIAITIAEALDYAHRQGLIHQDVKPENILFKDGEAYLADFGIARAIEKSLDESSTTRLMIRGTPQYMSPEQATGEQNIDGRSDVFSLGCVLYEMLAGVPAYIGATPEAVLRQRLTHPPRELRVFRITVPPQLEAMVMKSLARVPGDRFRTAGEMAVALRTASLEPPPPEPSPGPGPRPRRVQLLIGAVLAGVAGVLVALYWNSTRIAYDVVDTMAADTTYIVALPLERDAPVDSSSVDDDLLYDALAGWQGITVVDQIQVRDALRQRGPIRSSDDASALARSLGAGRYVRGTVRRSGNTSQVYAWIYDVGKSRALYPASQIIPSDPNSRVAAYALLADSLLLRGASVESIRPRFKGRNRSLPAYQAFHRALVALDEWNLTDSDSALAAAVQFDREDARANLWLGQVRAWRDLPATTWAPLAERALASAGQLSLRERKLAEALTLLGGERYSAACDVYEQLRRRTDRDFAAWFGLGQCRTMDKVVVRDSSSPSRWRFHSSYHRATAAYTRAFEILPSVHRGYERGAFEGLRHLMQASTYLVTGRSTGHDSSTFLARLGLLGDTLVLVPYPWQLFSSGDPRTIPPGFVTALERQRNEFRRIAARWSAAFPNSGPAKQAVALSLELLGDPAAIDTLRLARRLTADSSRLLQLAVSEALLLVKFGVPDRPAYLSTARSLGDSLLRNAATASIEDAEVLAPLAALTGRCHLAEQLARRTAPPGGSVRISSELFGDANALLARLALGCPSESASLSELWASITRELRDQSRDDQLRVEQMLLLRPALFAGTADSLVVGRLATEPGNQILRAAQAFVVHDTGSVRAALRDVATRHRYELGAPTPDMTYPGATLWTNIGDTAQAIAWLDRTLVGVRTYDPSVLTDQPSVAGLVRSMILRADLAMATRDGASARRWGSAVALLWSGADKELQESAQRMSKLARVR
jgi:hypothetical protein